MARLLIVLALVSLIVALVQSTRESCSTGQPLCLKHKAKCNSDGDCVCKGNRIGNPHLSCVLPKHDVCTIVSDPYSNPYSGGSAEVYLPCRYQATDVTVKKKAPGGGYSSTCRARIFAYGWRIKGKVFLRGFDARLDYTKGSLTSHMSLKAFGGKELINNATGEWGFEQWTRHSQWMGGNKWQNQDVSVTKLDNDLGGTNNFAYNSQQNRMELGVSECGLDINFRLPNTLQGGQQTDLPGLSIAIANNPNKYELTYNDVYGGVCLTPTLTGSEAAAEVDAPKADAFTYKAAQYHRGQAYVPEAPKVQCGNLQDTAQDDCTEKASRKEGLAKCRFILKEPLFLREITNEWSSHDAIALYDKCLSSFCTGDVDKCTAVKDAINANSAAAAQADSAFMNFNCAGLA